MVGVAPTALYGDIVIGIPYRKQFMFGVQVGSLFSVQVGSCSMFK